MIVSRRGSRPDSQPSHASHQSGSGSPFRCGRTAAPVCDRSAAFPNATRSGQANARPPACHKGTVNLEQYGLSLEHLRIDSAAGDRMIRRKNKTSASTEIRRASNEILGQSPTAFCVHWRDSEFLKPTIGRGSGYFERVFDLLGNGLPVVTFCDHSLPKSQSFDLH